MRADAIGEIKREEERSNLTANDAPFFADFGTRRPAHHGIRLRSRVAERACNEIQLTEVPI